MKTTLLLFCSFFFVATVFAAPKKYMLTQSTANWMQSSVWAPAGIPQNGDTLVIPAGITLTFNDDVFLSNVYIDIFGRMELSGLNLKAIFTGSSTINLEAVAILYGSKASQQIVMDNIIFKGNAVPLVGPKIATSLSNGFVTYGGNSTLPVTLIAFTVTPATNSYLVKWTTAEEQNVAYFEVQRSNDGASWKSIATVFSGGKSANEYSFTDKSAAMGYAQFRIKEVDQSGTFTYSVVRFLKNAASPAVAITAAHHTINISLPVQLKGNVQVEIIGLNGVVHTAQTGEAKPLIQLHTALTGFYIVRVCNSQGLHTAKQLVL
ncbi:MAG TPA: hypothetical protein VM010_01705 [Chitinophagaceae bacterium]|nr:hypothetical protein [Chitinophagaceae bacterium]